MYHTERLEGRTLFASYSAASVLELIAAINHANNSAQEAASAPLSLYRQPRETR
jgi:hypothetical protein